MNKKLTFGICAPSGAKRDEYFRPGIEKLRALGHELVIHPQTYDQIDNTQRTGTPQSKIQALYDLLEDARVDTIMAVRGGSYALHLLEHLDFSMFARHPKPYVGYSDSSVLLNAIHAKTSQITYHGPMVHEFRPDTYNEDSYLHLIDLLNGRISEISLEGAKTKTTGTARGRLFGGNLSRFLPLIGTPYCPNLDGAILFFEGIDYELDEFDNRLLGLKLQGIFKRAAGIIFGQFTKMRDAGMPFGYTVEEIIAMHTSGLNIPVVTNAPFGHTGMFNAFPVGAIATLDARGSVPTLTLEK